MVIFSHLSDVQEMIERDGKEEARQRINFVKTLVTKLNNGVKTMEEEKLNELWRELDK